MTYSFRYANSEIYGSINEEISEDEEKLIINAIKKSFDKLEDTYELKSLRKRIFDDISRIESVTEDDILWIYFPDRLTERVLFGK